MRQVRDINTRGAALSAREWSVLIALATHTQPDRLVVSPSQERLAALTGMSKSSVIRALKSLQSRGFITCRRSQGSNFYKIADPVTWTLPECHGDTLEAEKWDVPECQGDTWEVSLCHPEVSLRHSGSVTVTPEVPSEVPKEEVPKNCAPGGARRDGGVVRKGKPKATSKADVVHYLTTTMVKKMIANGMDVRGGCSDMAVYGRLKQIANGKAPDLAALTPEDFIEMADRYANETGQWNPRGEHPALQFLSIKNLSRMTQHRVDNDKHEAAREEMTEDEFARVMAEQRANHVILGRGNTG